MGGLVTAVAPVVIESDALWVGWTGLSDYREGEIIPEPQSGDNRPTAGLRSNRAVPVIIPDARLFHLYYNGCCNGTFWPLFHSMPERAVFLRETWHVWRQHAADRILIAQGHGPCATLTFVGVPCSETSP